MAFNFYNISTVRYFLDISMRYDPDLQEKALDAWEEARQAPQMNEFTSRDINAIAASIQAVAGKWAAVQALPTVSFLGVSLQRTGLWSSLGMHPAMAILPVLKDYYSDVQGAGKVAIELGSGNSPAVPFLLARGWKVIAVDSYFPAITKLMMNHRDALQSEQLKIVTQDISTYQPEAPADLVIASDVFPFTDPARFMDTWRRIHNYCVTDEGFFVGTLFCSPSQQQSAPLIHTLKDMGAWTLPDRRMVRPLLTYAGYEIKTCQFRQDIPYLLERYSIQFVARKITTPEPR